MVETSINFENKKGNVIWKDMSKRTLLSCFLLLSCAVFYGQGRMNDSLVRVLDTVALDDEMYRDQLDDMVQRYGGQSKEVKELYRRMQAQDSINQIKVCAILDKYGWLGSDVLGEEGNGTLFFVLQHAELPMQAKYLPLLRTAVKEGRAKARHLALVEDRVALRQGKKQIYGSQVGWDMRTNTHYVMPLEDPDHVDQRRAAVGLPPLAEYLQNWQLKWDVQEYKKDLPRIEALKY
jgi:hypothetical protein